MVEREFVNSKRPRTGRSRHKGGRTMSRRKISGDELEICGKWVVNQGKVEGDENCHRIETLIVDHLRAIGSDWSGWNRLYQDPDDDRYWELTYPESELHGGGPPCLACISEEEARQKYSSAFGQDSALCRNSFY